MSHLERLAQKEVEAAVAKFEQYRSLATDGDVEAQYWIAHTYFTGNCGVERDKMRAAEWFQTAAADGKSGKAMWRLGQCYDVGLGVRKNRTKAQTLWNESISLLKQEAEEVDDGDAESMYVLAAAYSLGHGTATNQMQCLKWIQQAAEREHAESQSWLGSLYMAGELVEQQSDQLGLEWYLRAAKNGNTAACERVGTFYQNGLGTEDGKRNLIQALHWFQIFQAKTGPGAHAAGGGHYAFLLDYISRERDRLQAHVKASLVKFSASFEALQDKDEKEELEPSQLSHYYSLGLWARGLATLLAQHNQPSGIYPCFFALTQLAPHLMF